MRPEDDVPAFLSAVFHDLRGGLQSMINFTHILKDGNLDPAARARTIALLESSLNAQTRLIQDLSDLSAMTSGQYRLESAPCDLRSVILMNIETWRRQYAGRKIAIESDLGSKKAPIRGDMDRLLILLGNLVANAVNASADGGRVDLTLTVTEDRVTTTVSDNGCGIPPEFVAGLFEPFRRKDKAVGKKGGFSLGLSIAWHLAELHGGTLDLRSDGPGLGAEAVLSLPLSP